MRTFLSIVLLLLCAALIVLASTNPQLHDFETFVEAQSGHLMPKKTGGSSIEDALSGKGKNIAGTYTEQFARRQDYLIFSVYTFDPGGVKTKENKPLRFLGIADRFFPLNDPAEKQEAQ